MGREPLKILIADDESLAREKLKRLLAKEEGCAIIAEASHGEQVLSLVQQNPVDLVLLDISMPGMDGLACAEALAQLEKAPVVIFTTAYDQHALAAFQADALDYVLKPVTYKRLQQALNKVRPLIRAKTESDSGFMPESYLCIHRRQELLRLPLADVLAVQAEQKYITVYHAGGEDLLDGSLKQLEQEYPDNLLRVHRNCLVAYAAIQGLQHTDEGYYIQLAACEFRPQVSRRHLSAVKRFLEA